MATRKTEETVETVETGYMTMEEGLKIMKTIHLPKAGKNEAKSVYVGVNDKTWQVPRGKDVEVPLPVYDVLMRSMAAQEAEQDYAESIPNEG